MSDDLDKVREALTSAWLACADITDGSDRVLRYLDVGRAYQELYHTAAHERIQERERNKDTPQAAAPPVDRDVSAVVGVDPSGSGKVVGYVHQGLRYVPGKVYRDGENDDWTMIGYDLHGVPLMAYKWGPDGFTGIIGPLPNVVRNHGIEGEPVDGPDGVIFARPSTDAEQDAPVPSNTGSNTSGGITSPGGLR